MHQVTATDFEHAHRIAKLASFDGANLWHAKYQSFNNATIAT